MRPMIMEHKSFKCCGKMRGGTYLVKYGYDFTCLDCGKRHRSWWNRVAMWWLRMVPDYASGCEGQGVIVKT